MDNYMDNIEFTYINRNEDNSSHRQIMVNKHKECLTADEVCEMFLEFMESIGYAEQNIYDYFRVN